MKKISRVWNTVLKILICQKFISIILCISIKSLGTVLAVQIFWRNFLSLIARKRILRIIYRYLLWYNLLFVFIVLNIPLNSFYQNAYSKLTWSPLTFSHLLVLTYIISQPSYRWKRRRIEINGSEIITWKFITTRHGPHIFTSVCSS